MTVEACQGVSGFVESFCEYQGLKRQVVRDGIYRFQFEDEIITYTHRPELIGLESAEYLTYGHPLLDRLISSARSRGWAANLIYPLSRTDYDNYKQRLNDLPVKGSLTAPLKSTLLYQAWLVFTFRVSLLADIRKDELVSVAADPETDLVKHWEMPQGLCSVPEGFRPVPDRRRYPRAHTERGITLDSHLTNLGWLREVDYRTFQLYRRSCLYLQEWLGQTYTKFEQEQLARLGREQQVLDEYYDTLLREEMAQLYELLHKAAVLEVRVALAKSRQTEALFSSQLQDYQRQIAVEKERCTKYGQELAIEKGKRLHELKSKYLPQALVSLVSVARVYLPRAVITVRNPHNLDSVRLIYDFYSQRWLDLRCNKCDSLVFDALVACETGLLCSRCIEKCEVCNQYTKLPAAICPGCGRKICQQCRYPCLLPPSDNPISCGYCQECGQEVCPPCNNLSQIEEIPT